MDSLVASYASSDEEGEEGFNSKLSSKHGAGILSSLPPPKSSLFNSLPPPKSQFSANPSFQPKIGENSKPKPASSSLFSSMPQPKSSVPSASSKRVVQFRPPSIVDTSSVIFNDDDEVVDEGERERQRKKAKESTHGAPTFSLPAPRFSNSLGTLGGGRKSMFETVVSEGSTTQKDIVKSNLGPAVENAGSQSGVNLSYSYPSHDMGNGDAGYAYYGGYDTVHAGDVSNFEITSYGNAGEMSNDVNYTNPGDYSVGVGSETVDYSYDNVQHVDYTHASNSYSDYGNNQQYGNNWVNPTPLPEVSDVISELRIPAKRGRKDVVPQIIEVKQDELVKDRPREDQVKKTGIAFGPAYQPASSKCKPSKLHKRKHQISALYFDMRQKETELAERRSRGYQTKAQTQGKYGW